MTSIHAISQNHPRYAHFYNKNKKYIVSFIQFCHHMDPRKFVLLRKVSHIRNTDFRERIVFVNGNTVSFGPCKSYPSRWYYKTVDIATQPVSGKNVISAKVL